jgi:hypothetical protein
MEMSFWGKLKEKLGDNQTEHIKANVEYAIAKGRKDGEKVNEKIKEELKKGTK